MSMNYSDYIHLKYYNYINEVQPQDPATIFADSRAVLVQKYRGGQLNKSNPQDLLDLEQQLNFFYNPNAPQTAETNLFGPNIAQQIDEAILQHLQKEARNKDKNDNIAITKTGKAGYVADKNASQVQIENIAKKINVYFGATLDAIEARITELQKTMAAIDKQNNIQYGSLKAQMNAVEAAWRALQAEANNKGQQYITRKNNATFENFVLLYNTLLANIFDQDSNLTGYVGELSVAVRNYLYNLAVSNALGEMNSLDPQTVEAIINQAVDFSGRNSVRGAETSIKSTGNLSNNALGNLLMDDIGKDILKGAGLSFDQDNCALHIKHSTQNKVDVVLQFNGRNINTSIKNYDLSSKKASVHIVTDTNPIILLHSHMDLVRHYLNVASEHGYDKKDKKEPKKPKQNLLYDAHNTIKTIMFAEAVAGGQLAYDKGTGKIGHTDSAEIFIVHDTSKGYYRCYWISDLVQAVAKNQALVNLKKGQLNSKQGIVEGGYIGKKQAYPIGNWKAMDKDGKQRVAAIYKAFLSQRVSLSLEIHALNEELAHIKN